MQLKYTTVTDNHASNRAGVIRVSDAESLINIEYTEFKRNSVGDPSDVNAIIGVI